MGPKVARLPVVGISKLPLGSLGTNDNWVLVMWPGIEYPIRGKVVASHNFRSW